MINRKLFLLTRVSPSLPKQVSEAVAIQSKEEIIFWLWLMMVKSLGNVCGAWEDDINIRARETIEATLIYDTNHHKTAEL